MIKAVIFDIDGTLYDYRTAKKAALQALEEYAAETLQINMEEFHWAYAWGRSRTRELLPEQGAGYSRLLYAQHALEYLGLSPISYALEMERVYWTAFLSAMEPFDGITEFMSKLKARGIKIAICTDMTAAVQHEKLRKLKLVDWVDVLVTSEEAGRNKPSPQIFRLVLEKLRVEGKEAVMIGDSPEGDVRGAEAMGIKGVLFTSKGGSGEGVIGNYTDGEVEKLCGM